MAFVPCYVNGAATSAMHPHHLMPTFPHLTATIHLPVIPLAFQTFPSLSYTLIPCFFGGKRAELSVTSHAHCTQNSVFYYFYTRVYNKMEWLCLGSTRR